MMSEKKEKTLQDVYNYIAGELATTEVNSNEEPPKEIKFSIPILGEEITLVKDEDNELDGIYNVFIGGVPAEKVSPEKLKKLIGDR